MSILLVVIVIKAAAYYEVTVTLLYNSVWNDDIENHFTVPITTGVLLDNSNGTDNLYNK